ncbi:MAG: helix-turn-helix transcriptional regulator [Rhizobiaceae bacterium]
MRSTTGQIEQARSRDQYMEQVFRVFTIYGLGHGCLHSVNQDYSPAQALWRVTPDDVTSACSYLVETKNHPAVRLGENRHFAFDLFDFRDQFSDDPDVESLYRAFENNGVFHAYGLPIQTVDSGTFVFVVARVGSAIDTVELLTLQAICSNAVNGVQQFVRRPCEDSIPQKLTAPERQLLLATAGGSTITEISEKSNLSELTVRSKVDHIVEKLGARNVSHAIILSLIEGEIGLEEVTVNRLQ